MPTANDQPLQSENPAQQLLYVQTSGIDTPERLYSPFVLAQAAQRSGHRPIIFFLGLGLTVLRPGAAADVQLGSFPSLATMIENCRQQQIPLIGCKESTKMLSEALDFDAESLDLIEGVELAGPERLNQLVLASDGVLWF